MPETRLTSSLVVWSVEARYVWKPASPSTDQTLRKQTAAVSAEAGDARRAAVRPAPRAASVRCVTAHANTNTAKKESDTTNA